MTPDQIAATRKKYDWAKDNVDEVLVNAMEATFKAITGAPFSERLREAIFEALRND